MTVAPALQLNGAGTDVDSVAFWEAPDPGETLMFVTGKSNDVVEVWKYPFLDNELAPIRFSTNVNGVAVDQDTDLLYVSDRIVSVFSLPGRQLQNTFGRNIISDGENNLDLLRHANGQSWLYISDDHKIHRFNAATFELLGSFTPAVSTIETIVADDFHQVILVPEEQGPGGNPGVFAYHPDGAPFNRNGTNRFGNNGEFDSDEEGILLYTFPAHGSRDYGSGFIVVADQRSDVTDFEFFDRQTWTHLGKLRLQGVSNTDGIASTQCTMPGYPLGVFAAVANDRFTAVIGWDAIFSSLGWNLAPEAVRITPLDPGPVTDVSIAFTVVFSEPVTGFDEVTDLVINHQGTSSTGAVITGAGTTYSVTLSGISGSGSISLAINTAGNVVDSTAKPVSSSVTSVPVVIETPYSTWAVSRGLLPGANDGPADDPDGDGIFNLAEFASDNDPLSGGGAGKNRPAIIEVAGADFFSYTFPVRTGAAFGGLRPLSATKDGVTYSVSASRDLLNFNEIVVEHAPPSAIGLPPLANGWNYRTFRFSKSLADAPAGFILLSVETSVP